MIGPGLPFLHLIIKGIEFNENIKDQYIELVKAW